MPRIVRHEATGPIRIDPQDKPVFVCACGLSRTFPFCDGAHKGCKDEDPHTVYVYEDGQRRPAAPERESPS